MTFETHFISELIDEISMGPFGSNIKVECFVDEGIPVLNGSNLEGYELKEDSFRYVTEEKADSLNKANAYRGDVVITHRGTLGQIVFIPQTSKYDRYVISQSQFRIRCNDKILPEYMVYYFHTRIGQHKLLSNASQVGVPALARPSTTFQKIDIEIPDITTQRRIVAVLQRIHDKIAVNTAINENLEQQAQAIFKSWFGADIENLNPSNCKSLGELVTSVDNRGKTPPLSNEKTEYPIIDVRALSGSGRIINFSNCTKYVEEGTYNNWFRNGHPKDYDILISTVGSLAEMKIYLGNIGCIAQNVVGFRSKGLSPIYLYQYLNYIRKELVSYNIGSVQPSIKVTHIIKHPIFIPENDKIEKFDMLIKDYTLKIYNNCCENKRLVELRDTLLPKLMNGEIDISKVKT